MIADTQTVWHEEQLLLMVRMVTTLYCFCVAIFIDWEVNRITMPGQPTKQIVFSSESKSYKTYKSKTELS